MHSRDHGSPCRLSRRRYGGHNSQDERATIPVVQRKEMYQSRRCLQRIPVNEISRRLCGCSVKNFRRRTQRLCQRLDVSRLGRRCEVADASDRFGGSPSRQQFTALIDKHHPALSVDYEDGCLDRVESGFKTDASCASFRHGSVRPLHTAGCSSKTVISGRTIKRTRRRYPMPRLMYSVRPPGAATAPATYRRLLTGSMGAPRTGKRH